MREVILGTAGHVDHGKTSLIRALTGIDTDRLKEEKERGITIELGFAYLDLPCGQRLGIVDVPGHERFVKNMVAGVAGIDLVAFVIAADEGIMPQTREHFEICSLLGIRKGLIVITKIDMVDAEWLELVEEEIGEFFGGSFLDGAPVVKVSSTTGAGIDEVRKTLDQMAAACKFTEPYGPFRLPVDRVFTMKGFGVVVTGTSMSGRIKDGDDIVIYPRGTNARIRGLQVHGVDVEEAWAGNRTAINIQGIDKEVIARGDVVAAPASLRPSYMLDADFLYLSSNKKVLKNRTRVRFHLGTAEIMGRIVLLDHEELEPGTRTDVQLLLEEDIGVWPGDRYVVRSYSPVTTIGGGRIFNNAPLKRRRFKEVNREIFNLYHSGTLEEQVLLHVRESGVHGLTLQEIAIRMGVFGKRLNKILDAPLASRKVIIIDPEKRRMLAAEVYENILSRLAMIISDFHKENPLKPGLAKEELRSRVPYELEQKIFQLLLNDLGNRGIVVQEAALVRMADHQVVLKDEEEKLRKKMEEFYKDAGLAPPTVKEVMARFAEFPVSLVREVLDLLVREKILIKVNEDLYFHGGAINELQGRIYAFLGRNADIDAPRFKEMTGLTRKFSIPLLEYFDRIKLTMRIGDKRVLREKR